MSRKQLQQNKKVTSKKFLKVQNAEGTENDPEEKDNKTQTAAKNPICQSSTRSFIKNQKMGYCQDDSKLCELSKLLRLKSKNISAAQRHRPP